MSPREARLLMAKKLLSDQFADVEVDYENALFTVTCEQINEETKEKEDLLCLVSVEFSEDGGGCKFTVECADEQQGALVRDCMRQLGTATAPFSLKL